MVLDYQYPFRTGAVINCSQAVLYRTIFASPYSTGFFCTIAGKTHSKACKCLQYMLQIWLLASGLFANARYDMTFKGVVLKHILPKPKGRRLNRPLWALGLSITNGLQTLKKRRQQTEEYLLPRNQIGIFQGFPFSGEY